MTQHAAWETVIGLEIHAQLNTKSKLFSSAPNSFGDEPNVNITEVCTGQPGALPVLNREAVRKAVQFGCAIGAEVAKFSKFDRKSYFYPDSPRNFQITQYDQPIVLGGSIVAEVDGVEQHFAINRAHIEDDAGMLKHFTNFAGVDYNRAGVPLIEIVSEPCMHSPRAAAAYAMAVRAILQYIDACDCNMEEGSFRMDANVSVRRPGEPLRNKIEIKNMNSFSNMEMALTAEIERQIKAYEAEPNRPHHEVIAQETYGWNAETKKIILMRRKERADDYRYVPEPDLLPIILTDAYIEEIRQSLPELPLQRERRYIQTLGLPRDNAFLLVSDKVTADYFENALRTCSNARNLCNWITVEFTGRLKESGKTLLSAGILPEHLANLVNMIDSGKITGKIAKAVADEMLTKPGTDSCTIVAANPAYQPVDDRATLETVISEVLAENAQSIVDYHTGKARAFGFLIGQVMKKTEGKANPILVNELLRNQLNEKS
jgi:aspartyl-tRNA(Asn)/glutamyl-tRNA(Gln) amidotransferase subunit B